MDIDPASINAAATAILVIVTAVYVVLTFRISSASSKAAKAAERSAAAAERVPLVVSRLGELRYRSNTSFPEGIHIIIENIGAGPALSVQVEAVVEGTFRAGTISRTYAGTIDSPHLGLAPGKLPYLQAGLPRDAHLSTEPPVPDIYPPYEVKVSVTYDDIYSHHWQSISYFDMPEKTEARGVHGVLRDIAVQRVDNSEVMRTGRSARRFLHWR